MTCAATVESTYCSLKAQQGLDAARHARVFVEARLFDLHVRNLRFEFAILAADTAQVGIVRPEVLHPILAVHDRFFNGSDGGDGPQADEAGFAFLRRTADLHRQRHDLGEQDGRQHDQVLIAAKESIHTLRRVELRAALRTY